MNRRHVLLAIGSATGVGGYFWLFRSPVDPKPVPDRPANLTPETVTSYAAEHEAAVMHNDHLDDNVVELSVGCRSTLDRIVDDAYIVRLSCGGRRDTREGIGRGRAHQDLGPVPLLYIVDDESTTRFRWIGYRRRSDDRNPVLRCANFTDADQQVSIAVTPHNGTPDPVFRQSITVHGEHDETIENVVDDYGMYDVIARLDDDTTKTYEWEYTEDTAEDSIGVGIYIMPDGTIDIDVIQTT